MVNINIRLPDDLHKQLKLAAINADVTLKDYLIAQLDARLREAGR